MEAFEAFFVGIAALAGILVGFFLRGMDARVMITQLEQRNREIADALAKARSDAERNTGDAPARAAAESVAAEREKVIGQMSQEQERLRAEVQAKATRVTELEADVRSEREKKAGSYASDNQGELFNLLSPLRDQLNEFKEKVEKAQSDSNSGVTKLESLIGELGGLNQQLASEARNLSTALRGSTKAQGDFGEFILRELLEKAGLREGEQFSVQQSFRDAAGEDGREPGAKQTDVIVHLPGGRHLVIDANVPLSAHLSAINGETEDDRATAAREHLETVRGHVSRVAQANYHGLPGIQAPDFVVMFVPAEPALLSALKGDAELWSHAYAKGVLLAGPTTLLYVVRIVSMLWRQEDHNQLVKELTDHGSALSAKFAEFVTDMDGLGASLHDVSARYAEAKKKLSDGRENLVGGFEALKDLSEGAKLAKTQLKPFHWDPSAEDRTLSSESKGNEQQSERSKPPAESNGHDHKRAQELELTEELSSVS